MKKSAVLGLAIMLMANSTFAQENKEANLNNTPQIEVTVAENNYNTVVYCGLKTENKELHTHNVNAISNEAASEICGEKFSTTYFIAQFEKLALLKRSELSLKTVPLAIWNLDKYLEAGVSLPYGELGIGKFEEVKSFLAVDKFGKRKVITVSHLYKQNRKLYALNTSLISEKDQLYVLTSYDVDKKVFELEDDAKEQDIPEIIKRMQAEEEEKIINVSPAELDEEVRNGIWQDHMKFVKKYKATKNRK